MKKILGTLLVLTLMVTSLVGCGSAGAFDKNANLNIVSREDGSGTRGAFVELFGIEEKNANGEKVDYTTTEASITNNTSVMLTTVADDPSAIGYVSLGSLNDSVKALKINWAEPTVENVENGSYSIVRPFNIAVKEDLNDVAKDFINYILSADGQAVISDNGYIAIDAGKAFTSDMPKGKVVLGGSSSVSPVMEKLVEAYKAINANAEMEIQTTDSTSGIASAADGVCDIGMASRDLDESELAKGLESITIAKDGIAVIVNQANPLEELASDQVKEIHIGKVATWAELLK